MEEIWKQYDSKYEVSNLGRVRHIKHRRILKYNYPGNGTPQVNLSNHSMCVSHLVAELFLGKRPADHDIHHKDHNPSNNTVSNLEYMQITQHRSDHHRVLPRTYCVCCGKETRCGHKTCSRECFHKTKWTERTCKVCGKPFLTRISLLNYSRKDPRYKNGYAIYCSRECRNVGNENFLEQARQPKPHLRKYSNELILLANSLIKNNSGNMVRLAKEHNIPYSIIRSIKRGNCYRDLLAANAAHNSTTPAGQGIAQNSLGLESSAVELPSITTSQAGELRSASNLIAV